MKQEKSKDNMTVAELARMTNVAFSEVEIRFQEVQASFRDLRHEMHANLRETERHLIDAINGVEVRRPEFDALKSDVEDLSGRVGILEKKKL